MLAISDLIEETGKLSTLGVWVFVLLLLLVVLRVAALAICKIVDLATYSGAWPMIEKISEWLVTAFFWFVVILMMICGGFTSMRTY